MWIKDKKFKSNFNYNKQLRDTYEDVKHDIKNTKCRFQNVFDLK